jgi:hypothetical protein
LNNKRHFLPNSQSNELEINIDIIQLKDAGNYKCLAVNSIGKQAQEMAIKVLTTPKVKMSANWQEMRENSNYSLSCIVDGIKERRVEILWFDDDDNLLQSVIALLNF